MKKVDEKISKMLNNIIEDWFFLEQTFTDLYFVISLSDFVRLKAEFDAEHEDEEDEL